MTPDEVLQAIERALQPLYGHNAEGSMVVRVPEGVLILRAGGPHVLIRANIASLVVA